MINIVTIAVACVSVWYEATPPNAAADFCHTAADFCTAACITVSHVYIFYHFSQAKRIW